MNEAHHVKPEWIPAAYQGSNPEMEERAIKPNIKPLAPLYSYNKTLVRPRLSKAHKRP